MALKVTQSSPTSRKSTGQGKSQLQSKVTQATGASSDGSTKEATSQLATKVVVPPTGSTPKTGPEATTA